MTGLVDHLLSTPAWLTLLVVFGLPALESSAFVGFLFPGETAVLLGGVAAGEGHVPLAAVVAAGVGGAIAGDAVGYLVGRRWGPWLLDSSAGRLVNQRHLETGRRALVRRGGWAVFLGRFTVALRVVVPGLAGMAGMPYRRFAGANIAGGVAWGTLVATAGYLAGNSWQSVSHYVTGGGAVLTGGVVVLLIAHHLVRRVARRVARRRRTAAAEDQRRSRDRERAVGAPWARGPRASRPV